MVLKNHFAAKFRMSARRALTQAVARYRCMVACKPGEACWMRAGEPLLLHWLVPDAPISGMLRALCGEASMAWRCVDGDQVVASECLRCAAVAAERTRPTA